MGGHPDATDIRNTLTISESDRSDRADEMKALIGDSRYVVYTRKRLNQMTVRWGDREMRTHRVKHMESVQIPNDIPTSKTTHTGRTSDVSSHTLPECIKSAQGRQNWHSASG